MNKALIIVDVQNDFVTGSLAVSNAKQIIPIIIWMVANVPYPRIIETFDWHPENHISFQQWPKHCVQNTAGANSALKDIKFTLNSFRSFIFKGKDINVDSYSAFFDNDHKTSTNLDSLLREAKIDELDIVGLATDYCVKFTALDAIKLGYKTNVLLFACKGVGPNTTALAIAEMESNKINVI